MRLKNKKTVLVALSLLLVLAFSTNVVLAEVRVDLGQGQEPMKTHEITPEWLTDIGGTLLSDSEMIDTRGEFLWPIWVWPAAVYYIGTLAPWLQQYLFNISQTGRVNVFYHILGWLGFWD